MNSRKIFLLSLVSIALLALPLTASANHSWGKYHWSADAIQNLGLGDNVDGAWDSLLSEASADWSASEFVSTSVVAGSNPGTDCTPDTGKVEVCAADYGDNGWLGIAEIWASRRSGIISKGDVRLNNYYYSPSYADGFYDNAAWRDSVMCQEVGHIFGLDHQDENFYNANLGTCMDYTNDPARDDGAGTNLAPNAHDYEQLAVIYGDSGSSSGGPGNGKGRPSGKGGNNADASAFGRAIGFDASGRANVFEREVTGGTVVITHVTWTN